MLLYISNIINQLYLNFFKRLPIFTTQVYPVIMTVVKETSFPVTGCYSYNTYLKKTHGL